MTTTVSSRSAASVRIVEVGPRDGLQNVKFPIPTPTKLELVDRLHKTGLTSIEITSVVSPKAIPQLADCRQVLGNERIKSLMSDSTLRLPVLIPNVKGLDIAIASGVREVAVFVSATEGFSKANINATVDEGVARARLVAQKARATTLSVRGYVSCIFADPYDGPTPQAAVLKVVRELLDMGCYEVSLGDTVGVGTARDVASLFEYLRASGVPLSKLAGHFHDTYGQAVSNVWQAYQCGVRVFDSSVGGLGGCPFAPGAKGNVATEDVVYLFQQAGVQTGVDLMKLVETGTWISKELNKANESRAGSALAIKNGLMQRTKVIHSPEKFHLQWTLLSQTEGLKIYRSGVNIKLLLDRPMNGNALTTSMISDLTQFFEQARDDKTISRIIIFGEGKFFCTGMDLAKGSSPVAQSKSDSDAQYERLTRLFELIDNAPQVTIACINGPAFGGGVGLAFTCDIRIAVKAATMTLSEAKLGLCPATISKYVIREWGVAFAREAMLTTRPISMLELKSLGLVSSLVEDVNELSSALDSYLVKLKAAGPTASTMCKELVRLAWTNAGGVQQATGIKNLFDEMMSSEGEAAIGLKAFQSGQKTLDWDDVRQQKFRAKL
ncbi:hypothetical protein H2198_004291 [Neophaeococcomyces mojaviensis]|uniref:Uncharacterized protein n=1 Tax=Neophaeococcomyces mojaviensis TaxID=3383035 RepID=A0ACC3A8U2_9EURO|nr:hypothetical protein H2198_004291 [Knufia sp. JES_112]